VFVRSCNKSYYALTKENLFFKYQPYSPPYIPISFSIVSRKITFEIALIIINILKKYLGYVIMFPELEVCI